MRQKACVTSLTSPFSTSDPRPWRQSSKRLPSPADLPCFRPHVIFSLSGKVRKKSGKANRRTHLHRAWSEGRSDGSSMYSLVKRHRSEQEEQLHLRFQENWVKGSHFCFGLFMYRSSCLSVNVAGCSWASVSKLTSHLCLSLSFFFLLSKKSFFSCSTSPATRRNKNLPEYCFYHRGAIQTALSSCK